MFNRAFEVKLVKKNKKNEDPTEETRTYTAEDYANMASQGAYNAAFLAVKVVGSYMIFDTARKIAISRLSK